MIVVCAWCVAEDRPGVIREEPPYRDARVSHGICARHAEAQRAALRARAAARERSAEGRA